MEEIDDYTMLFMQPQYAHVSAYIDASEKYGLGYVLTNGNQGYIFNDETRMIRDDTYSNDQECNLHREEIRDWIRIEAYISNKGGAIYIIKEGRNSNSLKFSKRIGGWGGSE